MDYYDGILLLIPLVFLGLTVGLTVFGVSAMTAAPVAAAVAAGVIGHAMFLNPPVAPAAFQP